MELVWKRDYPGDSFRVSYNYANDNYISLEFFIHSPIYNIVSVFPQNTTVKINSGNALSLKGEYNITLEVLLWLVFIQVRYHIFLLYTIP